MICSKCGMEIADGLPSCPRCGAIFGEPAQPLNPTPPQDNLNYQNMQTVSPISNTQILNQNTSKKNFKIGLIAALLILVVAGIGIFTIFKKGENQGNSSDMNFSTSFFLPNKDNNYALFNADGEQLTDFEFSWVTDFANGTAAVRKGDVYGIIDEAGKMTVNFGKYEDISASVSGYEVRDKDLSRFLINGKGEVLYALQHANLTTFSSSELTLIEDFNDKTYKVLDNKGKTIKSLAINSDAKNKPSLDKEDDYVSIFYNGKNSIFNSADGKEIASFESDKQYCIDDAAQNSEIIIMHSCVSSSWESFSYDKKIQYKIIKDGKIYDFADKCDSVGLVLHSDNSLTCKKDYVTYLLDSDLNVGINISKKGYVDNDNYVAGENWTVNFYKNGRAAKTVECRSLKYEEYTKSGIYVLGTHPDQNCGTEHYYYGYYNSDGEPITEAIFQIAEPFDENGLAEVSEDGKMHYLIDANGKRISQDYSEISSSPSNPEYYYTEYAAKEGLIDKNGNVILNNEYNRIELSETKNGRKYTILSSNSKNILYDLEKKTEIVTLEGEYYPYDNYIHVLGGEDDRDEYYTYSGKLFYKVK